MSSGWYCYCLESDSKTTYIGATVNPDRRLRQHNREITGGAKATGRAEGWKRICCVTGFPDERSALQFEWKWKRETRRYTGTPVERRLQALEHLVNAEKTTKTSQPFETYPAPLCISLEDPQCASFKHKDLRYAIVETLFE